MELRRSVNRSRLELGKCGEMLTPCSWVGERVRIERGTWVYTVAKVCAEEVPSHRMLPLPADGLAAHLELGHLAALQHELHHARAEADRAGVDAPLGVPHRRRGVQPLPICAASRMDCRQDRAVEQLVPWQQKAALVEDGLDVRGPESMVRDRPLLEDRQRVSARRALDAEAAEAQRDLISLTGRLHRLRRGAKAVRAVAAVEIGVEHRLIQLERPQKCPCLARLSAAATCGRTGTAVGVGIAAALAALICPCIKCIATSSHVEAFLGTGPRERSAKVARPHARRRATQKLHAAQKLHVSRPFHQ